MLFVGKYFVGVLMKALPLLWLAILPVDFCQLKFRPASYQPLPDVLSNPFGLLPN